MRIVVLLFILGSSLAQANSGSVRLNVLQGTYIFGAESALRSVEATVSTCIAVTIFDPDTKTIFFAHADAGNDSRSLIELAAAKFRELNIPTRRLRAYVAGGWQGWLNESREIRNALRAENIRIVSYEEPHDPGFTIQDTFDLRPLPAPTRQRPIRTYIFDLASHRMARSDDASTNSAPLPANSHLRSGYLPNYQTNSNARSTTPEATAPIPTRNTRSTQ